MKPAHAHTGPAKTLNTCLGSCGSNARCGAARRRSKKRREGGGPGEGRCCRKREEEKEEKQLGDSFTNRSNKERCLQSGKVVCGGEF